MSDEMKNLPPPFSDLAELLDLINKAASTTSSHRWGFKIEGYVDYKECLCKKGKNDWGTTKTLKSKSVITDHSLAGTVRNGGFETWEKANANREVAIEKARDFFIREWERNKTSSDQVDAALTSCDKEAFERSMHRLQDFWSHFDKGYLPFGGKGWIGHMTAGTTPDEDMDAWEKAEYETKKRVKKWNNRCCRNRNGEWIVRPKFKNRNESNTPSSNVSGENNDVQIYY